MWLDYYVFGSRLRNKGPEVVNTGKYTREQYVADIAAWRRRRQTVDKVFRERREKGSN